VTAERRLARFLTLAFILLGCAAPRPAPNPGAPDTGTRRDDLRQVATATVARMTCRQAPATARGALRRLGYETEEARAPEPGRPGEVRAVKRTGWMTGEAGSEYHAIVELRCDNRGAELIAFSDESLFGRLALRRDFSRYVAELAVRRPAPPGGGHDTAGQKRLDVAIEPLRSGGTGLFGADLGHVGMTAVRVVVHNGTEREYGFAIARLQLFSQEGERRQALPHDEVLRRAGPELGAVLVRKALRDSVISSHGSLDGFLFFPASTYARASVVLIDLASQEAEGMSVEF